MIVIGITVAGGSTTGSASVAMSGTASCAFDAATTAGDYVQISSGTAGDCHDAGASVHATGEIIGRVLATIGSAGNANVLSILKDQ